MGTSQADKARSRDRIVEAAARQLREDGLANLNVGEVMKAAGLTHGGFYGHFESRAGLLTAALERALDGSLAGLAEVRKKDRRRQKVSSIARDYLTPEHRDHPGDGCAVAALAGEVSRAEPELRASLAARLERVLDDLAKIDGDGPQSGEHAAAALSLMVGGLVLSRMLAGSPCSDTILRHATNAVRRLEQGGLDQAVQDTDPKPRSKTAG